MLRARLDQLAFDLTPGEARVQLATTQHASGLTLGAIRHQYDNQRLAARGLGTELLSEQSGALRAGSGLLLSTFGSSGGAQMNAQAASASLTQAQDVARTLAQSARAQKAIVADEPQELAAIEALGDSLKDLAATQTRDSAADNGGAGTVPAWDSPMIIAEAAAGLVATTPADAALVSGRTLSAVAADINGIAQANSGWSAAQGIVLYAYGKASDTSRAITKTGLQLHAAHGPVSVRAQSDTLSINAQKRLTIASTESTVTLQGKDMLKLVAAGAALDLSGGNITLTAPGKAELKAASKNFTGPQAASAEFTPLAGSSFSGCAERLKAAASTQAATTDL
ncbi:type VI secretion system Vgr family protein [Niveibacterium sp. SC-1]|uniref:type VI secretion system Vgr family protein n=1 Tax=Niveibacterium sp. SC-1 TaxID=3135646 RepID=UPI00311F64FA